MPVAAPILYLSERIDMSVLSELYPDAVPVIAERVGKGAIWLDKVATGWAEDIARHRLDMSDVCQCVLGQILGWSPGRDLMIEEFGEMVDAFTLGFDASGNWAFSMMTEYELMEEAWLEEIDQRRTKP